MLLRTTNSINPNQLKTKIDNGESIFILDVRVSSEYIGWNISGSTNIPLSQLRDNLDSIPKDKEIITICAHGIRSERARQFLASLGYTAKSMQGGMVAWNQVYDFVLVSKKEDLQVLQIRRMGKGCLSYLIINGKEAVAIDPSRDVVVYRDTAKRFNTTLIGAIDTHTHADHVSGGRTVADAVKGFYLSPEGTSNKIKHDLVEPNSEITIGNTVITPIATPGHTPESVTYLLDDLAFTGDTLFVESVGRPDLGQDPKENAAILWQSVHTLLQLPQNTKVIPAHYGQRVAMRKDVPITATIEELQKGINVTQFKKDEFVEWVCKNNNPKPHNFEVIKRINQGLTMVPDEHELLDLEAGSNRCAVN